MWLPKKKKKKKKKKKNIFVHILICRKKIFWASEAAADNKKIF
jgi:hypothetical protein